MVVFTEYELAYLSTQPLGRLATQQPDGTLQVNPVGFRYNEQAGTIDIGGHNRERSRKYRNVAANGRVALVVDDLASVQPWRPRYVEIRGWAETIQAPAEPMGSGAPVGGPVIRVHPSGSSATASSRVARVTIR